MKTNYAILILCIGIFLLLFSACNSVKYVADNEYLLTDNTVKVNDKKNKSSSVNGYILQKPNSSALGLPLGLYFYNLGNKDYITDYQVWKDSFPGREKFFTGVFSEKQSRAYRNSRYNFNQWIFNKGEAPVILDSLKTKSSAERLRDAFVNQGYFRAKVNYEQHLLDGKKATVDYYIETDSIFTIDSITTDIKSPILDSIYQKYEDESLIKSGGDFNLEHFEDEADRITSLFRNYGVYHFTRNAIGYEGDSTSNSYTSDIKLTINDRIIETSDSIYTKPYRIFNISKINIYPDYSFTRKNEEYAYTSEHMGYSYLAHDEIKYNKKHFSNFLFLEADSVYSDINTDLTRRNLRRLRNFRLVNIKYNEIDSTNLEANIYLTPFKKYSITADTELTHSNIKELGISGRISMLSRNVFKDASNLQFSIQGSFFNSNDAAAQNEKSFFNAWEFGADLTLEVPRILFPINLDRLITKQMLPKTSFTAGTSFQKNIGLDKQKITGIMDYRWQSNKTNTHKIELLNGQFIKNLNVDSYFDIYQSEYEELVEISESIGETTPIPPEFYDENGDLIGEDFMYWVLDPENGFEESHPEDYQDTQNINKQYDIITENVVIPSITYEFTYTNREGISDPSFSFFRAKATSSGLLATAIAQEPDDGGKKEFLGVAIAQFVKFDLEYKKFWGNHIDKVLAFRSFFGIAIPYGNSDDMPFSRSYFMGGANDLRAWQVYDLGPGSTNTGLEYNVGTMKFLTSLEYRFKLIDKFKGALFIDAGNIWDITDSDLIEPEGKFTGIESLQDIAVGSGIGLRYDFNFLVVRLDAAFKTYEPYLEPGEKWFKNYNFGHAVYNFGINYPF